MFVLREAYAGLVHGWRGVVVALAALVTAALALGVLVPVLRATARTADDLHATETVKILSAAGTALLLLAAAAFVANAVGQSILARRQEVEVMRLVGATHWFIRRPFLLQALTVALAGAALALALLALAKAVLLDPISGRIPLAAAPDTIEFAVLAALLPVACLAVAALGAGVTLRRQLRP